MSTTFVYVIGAEDGAQKIGISNRIETRLTDLQTACPMELKVHGRLRCDTEAQARAVERLAHRILHRQRRRGEWFDVTPERALEVVRTAAFDMPDGADDPRTAIVVARETGELTWDQYESALAYIELRCVATERDFWGGQKRANKVERKAFAAAVLARLDATIKARTSEAAHRALLDLANHGQVLTEDRSGLDEALEVVAAELERATSAVTA
jgi:hypothetical protein